MAYLCNVLLIFSSAICFALGIMSWFRRDKDNCMGVHILIVFLAAGLWTFSYGLIGLTPNLSLCYYLRYAGILGVDAFVAGIMLLFMSILQTVSTRPWLFTNVLRPFVIVFSAVDFFLFSSPRLNTFIRLENWTTWYMNDCWQRTFHFVFVACLYLMIAVFMVLLFSRIKKNKRMRHFMFFSVIASTIMLLFLIPDTVMGLYHLKAIPTSGFGAVFGAIVTYYGVMKLNLFNITLSNLSHELFNSINIGVLVFDTDECLAMANPHALKSLFPSKSAAPEPQNEIIGTKIEDIFTLEPQAAHAHFLAAKLDGHSKMKVQTREGNATCVVETATCYDSFGEPYGYVSAAYDISSSERLAEDLRHANHVKSNFLSVFSHEIRTPIHAILGMNEMIASEADSAEIRNYTQSIRKSGNRLLSLVGDILDLSKIEFHKMELSLANYQLATLISNVSNIVHLRAQEKNLEVSVDHNPQLPAVLHGDEPRIKHCILAVVANAIERTDSGSVQIRFTYEKLAHDKIRLNITVSDTGRFIKAEDMPFVFDSLQRSGLRKAQSGSGGIAMGLSVAKQVAELMDGTIDVRSESEKGTVFTIRIPQTIPDGFLNDTIKIYGETDKSSDASASGHFKAPDASVLVVDDVQVNHKVFRGMLRRTSVQIDSAMSGPECLELIRKKKYDVIFMDHMMPEMDGIRTFNNIRCNVDHLNTDTPVIALTANAVSGAERQYLGVGFADYIAKPVTSQTLEKKLMQYLPIEKIQFEKTGELDELPAELEEIVPEKETDFVPPRTDSEPVPSAPEIASDAPDSSISSMADSGSLEARFSFLNVSDGLRNCMGDADFYLEILKSYIEEDKTEKLFAFYRSHNWTEYQVCVHALKSSSQTIGAAELAEKALDLENAAKIQNGQFIQEHHEETMAVYDRLMQQIAGALS